MKRGEKFSHENNVATRGSAKEALKNSPGKTRGSSHFWNWSRKNRNTSCFTRSLREKVGDSLFPRTHFRQFPGRIHRQNYETKHGERVSSHNGPASKIKSNEVDEWKIPPLPSLRLQQSISMPR